MKNYLELFNNSINQQHHLKELSRIIRAASVFTKLDTDKTGGYLAICDASVGTLACLPVGTVINETSRRKRMRNATEKATRLFNIRQSNSFESADESKDQYGGGIYIQEHNIILAFSGFPPKLDEAVCIMYGALLIVLEEMFNASGDGEFRKRVYNRINQTFVNEFPNNEFIKPLAEELYGEAAIFE